ncbi:MAG: PilZ domain-containing protein [Acidobacteriaceae bacterium]|nr:PilZ domain-containing protein [Acidobacteriaceae bacterium]
MNTRHCPVPVTLRLADEQPRDISAEIRGISSALLVVYAPVFIPQNRALQIGCGEQNIQACVVNASRASDGTYELGLRITQADERRREIRISTNLSAKLQIHGAPAPMPITIVDLSPSGLGLELHTPVPVGATVSVDLGPATVSGQIKHCAQRWEKYRAGMRVYEFTPKGSTRIGWANHSGADAEPLSVFLRSLKDLQANYEATLLSLIVSAAKKPAPE